MPTLLENKRSSIMSTKFWSATRTLPHRYTALIPASLCLRVSSLMGFEKCVPIRLCVAFPKARLFSTGFEAEQLIFQLGCLGFLSCKTRYIPRNTKTYSKFIHLTWRQLTIGIQMRWRRCTFLRRLPALPSIRQFGCTAALRFSTSTLSDAYLCFEELPTIET